MSTGPIEPGAGPSPPLGGTPDPPSGAAQAQPPVPAAEVGPAWAADPYRETTDLTQIYTPEQREAYKQNTLTPGLPPWAFVVLSILTLGLFATIYHQLKQSKLPVVKQDDPGAGKAIGFMFIPYFNIYWYFVVWPRLVDRINFQYRLRGQPTPIERRRVIPLLIFSMVGWFLIIPGLVADIWLLVLGARLQRASNDLAEGKV